MENQAALYNFASIATAADGLIISRGNLGLDVAPEKMALVQKDVVSKCNLLGKPVIITRVVDTMADAPRPTRSVAQPLTPPPPVSQSSLPGIPPSFHATSPDLSPSCSIPPSVICPRGREV